MSGLFTEEMNEARRRQVLGDRLDALLCDRPGFGRDALIEEILETLKGSNNGLAEEIETLARDAEYAIADLRSAISRKGPRS